MAKHFPTPWQLSKCRSSVYDKTGEYTICLGTFERVFAKSGKLHKDYENYVESCTANMQRIIACVNACAGMKDPEKEIKRLKSSAKRKKTTR